MVNKINDDKSIDNQIDTMNTKVINKKSHNHIYKFTEEIGNRILDRIRSGEYVSEAVKPEGITVGSFYGWIVRGWRGENEYTRLAMDYTEARAAQAEEMFEDCLKTAKNSNKNNVFRDRLKIDILRWAMAKLHPWRYAERSEQTIKVDPVGSALQAPAWIGATVKPSPAADLGKDEKTLH